MFQEKVREKQHNEGQLGVAIGVCVCVCVSVCLCVSVCVSLLRGVRGRK